MNPSEKKRAAIRKAAFRCFRETGYHATTIDSICQEAGISKGSFYWYYSSKQEIFIDILSEWSRDVVHQLYSQFQESLLQEDYVTSITDAVTRETHRGRSTVPLLIEFSAQGLRDPEIRAALSSFYRRIRYAIGEMLRPVLGQRITDAELEAVSATIFGAYSGLMIQDLCDPSQAGAQETVRRFMSALRVWLKHESSSARGADPGDSAAVRRNLAAALASAQLEKASADANDEMAHLAAFGVVSSGSDDASEESSSHESPSEAKSSGRSKKGSKRTDPTPDDSDPILH